MLSSLLHFTHTGFQDVDRELARCGKLEDLHNPARLALPKRDVADFERAHFEVPLRELRPHLLVILDLARWNPASSVLSAEWPVPGNLVERSVPLVT